MRTISRAPVVGNDGWRYLEPECRRDEEAVA